MSIIKHYQYRGKLSELSRRFDAFKRLDRPHNSLAGTRGKTGKRATPRTTKWCFL